MANLDSGEGRLVWFIEAVGIWSINPYRGCYHGCVYCIAHSQGEPVPWHSPDTAIPELRAALKGVAEDTELFVGSLIDAYPPAEKRLGLTREILKELSAQARPFCVSTKSALLCRDIDILVSHPAHCDVYMSLCALDEDALRVLEPGAPSVKERLEAMTTLSDAGIDVNIDAAPWIPGISDAAALIARRPPGVGIKFAPLDLAHAGGAMTLLGRTYTQRDVNRAYDEERKRVGSVHGVVWTDPPRE